MTNPDKGYVFRATLEESVLARLLAAQFGADAFAIVNSVEKAEFLRFGDDEAQTLVSLWTNARVFDAAKELRWRKYDAGYEVLFLTEKDEPPENFLALDETEFDVRDPSSNDEHGFLLWGTTRVQDYWLETRIPRPLSYPIQSEKKLRLAYRQYQNHESVRWVRLSGLKEQQNG